MVKLRGRWVQIDPREWKNKFNMTVTVGLGTGSQQAILANVNAMGNIMLGLVKSGYGRLVSEQNAYQWAHEAEKALFPRAAGTLVTNPATLPPPQPQPNIDMMDLQLKAHKLELQDAQKKMKMDFDGAVEQLRQNHDAEKTKFQAMVDRVSQESEQQAKIAQEAMKASASESQIVLQGVVKQLEEYHKQAHERDLQQREAIAGLIEAKISAKAKKEKPKDNPAG